jgi:hypothetical protein
LNSWKRHDGDEVVSGTEPRDEISKFYLALQSVYRSLYHQPSTMSTAIATLSTPRDDLVESLENHNATFTKLLSLIPARFYLPPDQDELDSRWMKNKKRRTGEEIKEHKRKAKADKVSQSAREEG